MKGSPGGSSAGKSSVGSGDLGGTQGDTGPSVESGKPEVELSNLVMCSRMSQSQSSLKSTSSSGSVRGDEGGLYADFYGDYCPLFDNGQESDSASLRGKTTRWQMCCVRHWLFILVTDPHDSHNQEITFYISVFLVLLVTLGLM